MLKRYQSDHERYNAMHYPGTRQVCVHCGQPTGKCEEDSFLGDDGPLCEECFDLEDVMQKYLSAPCGMIPSDAGEYVKLADVEREMIPRPSEEEARSISEIVEYFDGLIKGEEYHQSVCDECHTSVQRSRDRVYKYKEWKAALLRLMGVEV